LPALIGVTVMIAMIMLGTISLAREREGGTWEALLALPIAPAEALIGKLMPYVVIGTVQGLLVLGAGLWLFDLPARGSVGALVAL
ncbi:ABC transporter permease, partial [Acinetobacter baumannii]